MIKDFDFTGGEVLLLDKPYKWTSFDVVGKVRSLLYHSLKTKLKVGHAGTLDPLASGLMIVCTGKKTKTIDLLSGYDKEYVANITFGGSTPSYDLETQIDNLYPYDHITIDSINEILRQRIGKQHQMPPAYSAKWVDGARAYKKARKGISVEVKPVEIELFELEIISYQAPVLELRILCSKGTYIRSLAHDLGLALNSGAHLSGLRRTKIGSYNLSEAHTMDEFARLITENKVLENNKISSSN